MNFETLDLDLNGAATLSADALVVLVPHGFSAPVGPLGTPLAAALQASDLATKVGKTLSLYGLAGVKARRVVFAGVADGKPKEVKAALVAVWAGLKTAGLKRLAVVLAGASTPPALRAAVLALSEASYVYTLTKSKPEPRTLQSVSLAVQKSAAAGADADAWNRALAQGRAMAEGIELAREWGNRPGNHATPTHLGDAAKALGKLPGVRATVLGPREVAKLDMGSFMAVAQGSSQPLRFIELRYQGGAKADAPTVLVGKGITFDTGGISLKPGAEMDEMKFDMCGAASVLGVFKALSLLKPKINVVGVIAACENMPSGHAVKPGDVVTSMSGQTIEILNTDAEGRLILCDALTYAERFAPRVVIDIATLTGACVVALGAIRSGMYASDEALAQGLSAAGDSALDPCWRMPLDDEYAEGLKSNFADVANIAGRFGGSITAAKFLQRFTAKYPWGHLDIAGSAWASGAAKGATGRPVGLLVDYLLAQEAAARPVAPSVAKPAAKPRRAAAK